MIERDYIMRMIQQLSGVLLRLLNLKRSQDYDQALDLVTNAYGELFGTEAALLRAMDSATAAHLLGHPEKIKALATLCREEADLFRHKGKEVEADTASRRALELFLEAASQMKEPDAECLDAIRSLTHEIDPAGLPQRYRDQLQALDLR